MARPGSTATGARTTAGTTVVVLAGGSGTRLGAARNKVYLHVDGRPLLEWSLDAFQASALVDDIVLVVRPADRTEAAARTAATAWPKIRAVVDGGRTRFDSERAALDALAPDILAGAVDLVAVHDAARPFVDTDLLQRVLTAARSAGGAIPGLPLQDPVLRRGSGGWAELVPTDDLRRVQTPQAFRARPLLEAFRAAAVAGIAGVDTAQTVARFTDIGIAVVEGDERNVKVTFAEDLQLAERHAAGWRP